MCAKLLTALQTPSHSQKDTQTQSQTFVCTHTHTHTSQSGPRINTDAGARSIGPECSHKYTDAHTHRDTDSGMDTPKIRVSLHTLNAHPER